MSHTVWFIHKERSIVFSVSRFVKLWTFLGLTNPAKLPKAPKFEKLQNAKETFKDAIEKSREDQYIGTDHFDLKKAEIQPEVNFNRSKMDIKSDIQH